MILAAVAGELVPDIVDTQKGTLWVVVGFLLGLALMIGVKLLSGRLGGGLRASSQRRG